LKTVNAFTLKLMSVQGALSMTPAANPSKIEIPSSSRSAFRLGETLLHMALSAAIPISAVMFVVLTF
jgi:hypothetical protein